MSTAHDDLLKTALTLPESERILLAAELLDSIPGELPGLSVDEPGFESELERRFNDGTKSVSWEEVSQQLKDDLNK